VAVCDSILTVFTAHPPRPPAQQLTSTHQESAFFCGWPRTCCGSCGWVDRCVLRLAPSATHHRQRAIPPAVAEKEQNFELSLLDTNPPYQTEVPLNPHTEPPSCAERERDPELASYQESLLYTTRAVPNQNSNVILKSELQVELSMLQPEECSLSLE
jgi:hypothetical protein